MNKDFKYKKTTGIDSSYFKDIHEDVFPSENFNDLTEPLGTGTLLFFKLNNREVISGMYSPQFIKVGKKINFEIDITKIHFFDHEKEKAI